MTTRRKGSQFKRGKGSKVTWWARVTFTDPVTRKRHDLQRRAQSKAHASQICAELIRLIDQTDGRGIVHERRTFLELAELYERVFAVPAMYSGDEKIGGLRDHAGVKRQIKLLRDHFGATRLRSLGYADIRAFRTKLFETPTRAGRKRSVATVNRVLALLRRMLNVAVEERWLEVNPFTSGGALIEVSKEAKRERVLSFEEEERLLAACADPRRAHLRPIIICALETGMRCGEILKLTWGDVDLVGGVITVKKSNTKTLRRRTVGIPPRLREQFLKLRSEAKSVELEAPIFGLARIKTAFNSARAIAGLTDLRFHDLRHSAASRLVQRSMPIAEVARILGHSSISTTFRYVNADAATLQRQVEIFTQISEEQAATLGVGERASVVN